jgi:serine/threonine-protein kinase
LRRLASGATSDVLLARAEGPHGFQRTVALKILLAAGKTDPEFERRFAATAAAYARLSHPAIVKLYDSFSSEGQLVMVLEYVDGLPLHKLRAMLAISGERIEDRAAVFLALRVFSALAAAHAARDATSGDPSPVVHGDVNPSNILVPWDGQAKLGDFGVAKARGEPADAHAGFIKGTYGYGAPEHVAGAEATARADIYSAGLILWELLARRKAVQRGTLNDAQVLKAMTHPEFPALELLRPDLDRALRTAVRRATEPDPEKRTITAEEVVDVLTRGTSVDEGRETLAASLTRLRPAGAASPPGGGDGAQAATPGEVRSGDVEDAGDAQEQRLDPEQTAPFEALTDDSVDLGKIAFYGSLRLPAESVRPKPLAPSPTPSPAPAGQVVAAEAKPAEPTPPAAAGAGDGLPADAPPLVQSATPPRLAPRPAVAPRHTDPFPAMAAPPAAPQGVDDAMLLSGRAPVLAPVPEIVGPAPPSTEPSPKAPSVAPPDDPGSVTAQPPPVAEAPVEAEVQPELPEEDVAPPARRRRSAWGVVLVLGIVIATGAIVVLFRSAFTGGAAVVESRGFSQASRGAPPVASSSRPPASAIAARPSAASPPSVGGAVATAPSTPPVAAPPPSASPQPSPPIASAPPQAVASVAPATLQSSAAPPAGATTLPADSGQIVPPASAAGHRVFVDGKVASEGTAPIRVRCGSHVVRIGSAGEEHKVSVPCGGSVNVGS